LPYTIRKVPGTKNRYSVKNTETGKVHAYSTTLTKANKQIKLLNMIDAKKVKGK